MPKPAPQRRRTRRKGESLRPGARGPRRTRSARKRACRGGVAIALLRLTGGALFLTIAVFYFSPLRDAARHARDAVAEATQAGRYAAARGSGLVGYSLRYGIPFDLAAAIEHAATEQGIDPDLAFRLVRVESQFKERAVSSAGALGLTQLMPATAAEMQPGITREEIFDRDTNLQLGFRYFRWLLTLYKGDVEEALHAYNRGPGTVARIRAAGGDPTNGYADKVIRGGRTHHPPYRGNGLIPTAPPPLPDPWTAREERARSPVSAF